MRHKILCQQEVVSSASDLVQLHIEDEAVFVVRVSFVEKSVHK